MTYSFRLEKEDGTPAEPPTLRSSVLVWNPGDTIPLGRNGALRVVDVRSGQESGEDVVLVVRPS